MGEMVLHVGLFQFRAGADEAIRDAGGEGQDAAVPGEVFATSCANRSPRVCSFSVTGSFTRQFIRGA